MIKPERIAVLGGGSWGCTLAAHLAGLGHDVALWEFLPDVAKKLQNDRILSTLPGFSLPASISVTNNIDDALANRRLVLSVTPSHTVRETFKRAKRSLKRGTLVISASKGIETKSLKTMSQVIHEIFTEGGDIVILSGPSHAEEVAVGYPAALVAASSSSVAARRVQDLMKSNLFRIYTSNDPLGVELGGSLKNVYALGCGIVDGLKLGDNVKAALMTRGLAEMTRLGIKMNAAPLTFFGLSGLGDLIVTCNSTHSRNRRLGEMIGQGLTLAQALKKMTMVAEGVKTTESAHMLALKKNVEMPIVAEMQKVLFENKPPRDSLKDLMAREVGEEMEGIVL